MQYNCYYCGVKLAYTRLPKSYDGAQTTNRSLSSILDRQLTSLDQRRLSQPDEVLALWPSLIGAEMSAFAKANRFQDGLLYVTVANSTVYSMLAGNEKQKLVSEIRVKLPSSKIRNIIFRLG
jgi:hypothetical protein